MRPRPTRSRSPPTFRRSSTRNSTHAPTRRPASTARRRSASRRSCSRSLFIRPFSTPCTRRTREATPGSRRPARLNRFSTRSPRSTGRAEGVMQAFRRLLESIEAEGSAALVTLARVQGSSPREAGARMVVRPSGGFHGTIGGGALEWAALEAAQAMLQQGRGPATRRSLALGPELAQCCGGRVEWRIETFDRRDLAELSQIAAAETRGPAALRASLAGDGRVERRLEGERRGDDL